MITSLADLGSAAASSLSPRLAPSALGLQRVLGFGSYETAWTWLHKLRRAMVRPARELLGGDNVTVEMDQTFIGGRSQVTLRIALRQQGPRL